MAPVGYEHTGSYSNEICLSAKRLSKFECSCRNELPHAAFSWEGADSLCEKVYVDMRRPLSEWYPSWRHQCNLPIWAEQMPIRNEKRCIWPEKGVFRRSAALRQTFQIRHNVKRIRQCSCNFDYKFWALSEINLERIYCVCTYVNVAQYLVKRDGNSLTSKSIKTKRAQKNDW